MDANDLRIFLFARQEGFNAVLTLDEDFYNILLEYNAPPKIIWLRTGNCATAKLAEVVIRNEEIIHHFLKSADQDCLEIFQ